MDLHIINAHILVANTLEQRMWWQNIHANRTKEQRMWWQNTREPYERKAKRTETLHIHTNTNICTSLLLLLFSVDKSPMHRNTHTHTHRRSIRHTNKSNSLAQTQTVTHFASFALRNIHSTQTHMRHATRDSYITLDDVARARERNNNKNKLLVFDVFCRFDALLRIANIANYRLIETN